MTVFLAVGSLPYNRPDATGLYYDKASLKATTGRAVLCWEHWAHDDHIAARYASHTVGDLSIVVMLFLDDAIQHEKAWLDAIRAGGVYLSHGLGAGTRAPAAARAKARQIQNSIEGAPGFVNLMRLLTWPLRNAEISHWALTQNPAMPQDEAVTVIGPIGA